jgi:hypothetical protein
MALTAFPGILAGQTWPVLELNGAMITTGNLYFVDSAHANASDNNTGDREDYPMATLDAAVGKCTANNGDVILVAPGGTAQSVTAAGGLDLDVAGITIIFLGEGNARSSITFSSAVGADMDVDAADITLINPRFVAGVDALTGPIDVNAARFKMFKATWQDGTSINTTDCVVADANADNMVIDDFEFVDGDAGGTQKQSFIQVAGATGVVLKNIRCTGDFGTGIIENGTAWVDATLDNLVLDNASASPTVCVLLQATSTGWFTNSYLRVASANTAVTANNDMQFANVWSTGTDATTGAPVGTPVADSIAAALYGDNGIATFPSSAVPGNGVSLAEVLRDIWDVVRNGTGGSEPGTNRSVIDELTGAALNYNGVNYLSVTAAGTSATWNTAASHEVFTVTGLVRMRIVPQISGSLTEAGASALITLGHETTTSAYIAATTAIDLTDGLLWLYNTEASNDIRAINFSAVLDKVVNALDVGYEVSGAALTGGNIVFHCWWEPLNSTGAVAAGAGGAL